MSKLGLDNTPGLNAGNNYLVKFMRVSEIKVDPEISEIFKIQETMRLVILDKIKKDGFDKSQPITIQKGTNIVLDGHTRLSAAIEAGLDEVPVVEREFDDRSAAVMYTFERQAMRRNLTSAEILRAVEMLPEARNRKGEGSAAMQLAERLGLHESTIYQAKKISKEATPEIHEKVKNGEMSIKAGYQETIGKKSDKKPRPPLKKATTTNEINQASVASSLNQSRIMDFQSNIQNVNLKISAAIDIFESVEENEKLRDGFELLTDAIDLLKTVDIGLTCLE